MGYIDILKLKSAKKTPRLSSGLDTPWLQSGHSIFCITFSFFSYPKQGLIFSLTESLHSNTLLDYYFLPPYHYSVMPWDCCCRFAFPFCQTSICEL